MNETIPPTPPDAPASDTVKIVVVVTGFDKKDPSKVLGKQHVLTGQCGMTTENGSLMIGSNGEASAAYAPGQWKTAQLMHAKKPAVVEGTNAANVEEFPKP